MNRTYLAALFLPVVAFACSSSTTSPGTPTSDAGLDAKADDAGLSDATTDGAAATVNGCTPADFAANDRTGASDERIIRSPTVATPAQFTPRCMRVKVGQVVSWRGDLASHPISYKINAKGNPTGDAGSSFVLGAADGAATENTATFALPVTVEFKCDNHPTTMLGALDVVP